MNLSDLKPNPGSTHRRKRIGRGPGSGHGKTSTRGNKGLKAHDTQKPGFEGGQTPLHRRLPQRRGQMGRNLGMTRPFRVEYSIVNLSSLEKFENGDTVSPETLLEHRLIGDLKLGVKILGDGDLTKKLIVRAHKFSKSAQEKITGLGGTTEIV